MKIGRSKPMSKKQVKHTLDIESTGRVEEVPGASRFLATITINKDVLDPVLDAYWYKVKDRLSPYIVSEALKGGFREIRRDRAVKAAGGVGAFFREVAMDAAEAFMAKQERKALVVKNVNMAELINTYEVTADVYLEPAVTWKNGVPGVDTDMVVKIPKMPDDVIERMVSDELKIAQDKSAVLDPVQDLSLSPTPGQVAVVNVESTIDGQRWEDGCSMAKKWPMDEAFFKVNELYQALLTMKPDEKRTVDFTLDDKFEENAGRQVSAVLSLIQVFDKRKPEIDDDLAKTNGFDTLEAWKAALTTSAVQEVEKSKETLIGNEIMSNLLNTEAVDVEPVPIIWMTEKAREIYEQSKAMVEKEDDLLDQFKMANLKTLSGQPVTDKQSVMVFLAEKATQQLVADLVFKSWGVNRGIEGSTALEDLPDYVKSVSEVLRSDVKIEEYEVQGAGPTETAEAGKEI